MVQHPNARLTPRGRETLVSRIESGVPVAEAAGQMGVSRQTASKQVRRAHVRPQQPPAQAGEVHAA